MQIVMAAHSFPRSDGDVAGAFLWRLAEALCTRGHSVTVVAPADRGDVGEPMLGKVKVRRVRYAAAAQETLGYSGTMHRRASTPAGAIAFARLVRVMGRAVTEEVRRSQAHIIHAHWWVPAGLAMRLGDLAGRPLVVTLHGTDVALARKLPLGLKAMAWVLRPAASVTAVSSFLASTAAEALQVPSTTIPLTPMPLALGTSPDPDAGRHGAIFVGRLTKQKGVHWLLEALSILKRGGPGLDLTIVGDGPERAALKAQAIALGISASFTGFVAPDLVAGYLRDKRVFILPATDEGLGLVVAEALTQGVPVVATRSGGIPDLLTDPEAGVLVPPADPMALAVAIRQVVQDERFKVGALRAGRALAERLSPERVAARFEEIYFGVRGRRSGVTSRPSGAQRASGASPSR